MEGEPAKYFTCNHSEELTPTTTIEILHRLERQNRHAPQTACRTCLAEGRGKVPVFDKVEDGFPIPLCAVCRTAATFASHVAPSIQRGDWNVNDTKHFATE